MLHKIYREYLLRPADGKLSPCKISRTVLGTLQSHSSSSFHTENIESQNFQNIFFVKSITSTNAEPLCQTSFELFESALAKLCLTIEEYKSIQLDTSYVQIQTLKFGLKICIYRSSTLPILFKFGLQLINHRFHLSSHTVIKTQLTVTSNYFIVFLT